MERWDEGNKKVGVLSMKDGILGGSPDSMAFYSPNEYYAPGQITWLANVRQQSALYTANGCMRPGGDGDGFQ
jgi:hypothetical protein